MLDPTAFGYADFHFSWGDHILGIFDSRGQQRGIMAPFMANGLRAVQRCVWVGPPESADRFRQSLAEIGGDLPTLEASDQLVIVSDVEFYRQKGVFDSSSTMNLLTTLLTDGQNQGYSTMRIATDVSWLRDCRVDPKMWEQFEVELTHEVAALPVVLVCQYDRFQLPGDIIAMAFRTHPVVIMGDRIRQNPRYLAMAGGTPPSEIM
jgi:hypothetical protein